jgi:lipid-binding SYLF domain-containing protein
MRRHTPISTTAIFAAVVMALAAPWTAGQTQTTASSGPASIPTRAYPGAITAEQARDASKHVNKAIAVVRMMKSDPEVRGLLQESKGVFLVPHYGRAALVVGGQGGPGVLLVHRNGHWSGPAFYNLGGVSIGAQAGVAEGQVAMILMDDKALNSFANTNEFSLNADAGLTIVNYSKRAHGELGRGDVIVWSDTEGAFANASVSVTDINYDAKETRAYHEHEVIPRTVVSGGITDRKAASLLDAMPS